MLISSNREGPCIPFVVVSVIKKYNVLKILLSDPCPDPQLAGATYFTWIEDVLKSIQQYEVFEDYKCFLL